MLDIRMPIGMMFAILGALLAAYGMTLPAASFTKSLGWNLDLVWGGVMVLFGGVMFAWMKLDSGRHSV